MNVLALLRKSGAILEGHFVGTSGRHLSTYINKDAIYPDTHLVSALCRHIAEQHAEFGVDAVVAPALGGIALSQWTAHHLRELSGREVLALFTEKMESGTHIMKRGNDKRVMGKRVLIVDDIVTTGGSLEKTIDAVRISGGVPIAAAVLVNRSPGSMTSLRFGLPFLALADITLESYEPHAVPEWLARIPVDMQVGHGSKMIA